MFQDFRHHFIALFSKSSTSPFGTHHLDLIFGDAAHFLALMCTNYLNPCRKSVSYMQAICARRRLFGPPRHKSLQKEEKKAATLWMQKGPDKQL